MSKINLLELFAPMNNHSQVKALISDHTHPINTTKVFFLGRKSAKEFPWGKQIAGHFTSPIATLCPEMLPDVAVRARFELLLPKQWPTQEKPVYIHLAGTGDHGFWRRRLMTALPLLKREGTGALLLENPFYGRRKPADQRRSQLNHVSDLFVMGLTLIFECITLVDWLEEIGLGPVGLTGISMGGHNASLAACVCPKSVPVVPCLSWSTAASVFTEGILSESVCWDVLQEQLFHSKHSRNETLLKVFKTVAERQISGKYGGSLCESTNPAPGSLFTSHPTIVPLQRRVYKSEAHRETLSLMQAVLNSATHFSNFSPPVSPELALFIVAKDDLYIPRHNVTDVRSLWSGW